MTDTASARLKARQQSQGSNTNTWGDDKLNEVIRLIDRAMRGVQSLAITGDTTLSWTNYVATNDGQVAWLTLTGSLSAAANLIVPSVEWVWHGIQNSTGQTITVKTSAGTGVTIPNGRQVQVRCDASDCYYSGPNYLGTDITEANNRDLVDYAALAAAIAASVPLGTAGTVFNSVADTTRGYLSGKINATGTGAATVTQSTGSPAGNEILNIAVAVASLGLTDGGLKSAGFTAAVNKKYYCVFGAGGTITFPAAATAGDVMEFALAGNYIYSLSPNGLKINSLTSSLPVAGNQTLIVVYTGSTDGWV